MGRAEPGMEGAQGEEGAANGAVWGDFPGSPALDQAGMRKISAFFAVIGRNGAFSHDQGRRDARPCCQSQRGLADSVVAWRCSVPAGSVAEEIREFVLSRGIGIEDEGAVGVEGEFRCLPGGGRFR